MQQTMLTPKTITPFNTHYLQWVSIAALSVTFVYIIDDLLGWLGLRLFQTPIAIPLAAMIALLLIPMCVLWYVMITHWDTLDITGAALGCTFAGALFGFYTLYPPAGFLILCIFAGLVYLVFHVSGSSVAHQLIITSMCLAFAAMTLLISGWFFGHLEYGAATRDTDVVLYGVLDSGNPYVDDADPALTLYQCNGLGFGCTQHATYTDAPIETLSSRENALNISTVRSADRTLSVYLHTENWHHQTVILP